MSTRMYRVNSKNVESGNTFNLSYDTEIIDFLNNCKDTNDLWEQLNSNGSGEVEIPVSALKALLRQKKLLKKNDADIKAIKSDIAFAKKQNEDYILYECY